MTQWETTSSLVLNLRFAGKILLPAFPASPEKQQSGKTPAPEFYRFVQWIWQLIGESGHQPIHDFLIL